MNNQMMQSMGQTGIGLMRVDIIEARLTRDVEIFGTMAPFVKI